MRVLVAAKDRNLRSILRSYLLGLGFDLEIVSNGLGCIASLIEYAPNVLVIQQGLLWGGSDGVMQWMQQERTYSDIAIVLLCDSGSKNETIEGLGIADHVQTPLCLNDLLRLGEVLNCLESTLLGFSQVENANQMGAL